MRGMGRLTQMEVKLFLREPAAVFFTLAFPVMVLLLFSSMFGNEPVEGFPGLRSVDVMAPSYTGMIIGTMALLGLPVTLSSYRQQGILRRLRATPLHAPAILLAQVLVSLLMTAIGITLLLTTAWLVYDLRLPKAPFEVAIAFVLASLSFLSVGFVLAGTLPSARTATVVGQVIFFPMFFLSGAAGIPREMLPDGLHRFSDFLPLTHVVELVQELWIEGTWDITAVAVLAAIFALAVALSARTFRWE